MGMQTQVGLYLAPAVAGDMATPDQSVYQAQNYTAETDVNIGTFAFAGTDAATQAKQGGSAVLGFVQRVINYVNYDITSAGSMTVKAGDTLTIAVKGDYWAKTLTAATVGQKVYANTTDGTIKTDDAGQTVAGHVETDWVVKTAGAANDLIIISNWA